MMGGEGGWGGHRRLEFLTLEKKYERGRKERRERRKEDRVDIQSLDLQMSLFVTVIIKVFLIGTQVLPSIQAILTSDE